VPSRGSRARVIGGFGVVIPRVALLDRTSHRTDVMPFPCGFMPLGVLLAMTVGQTGVIPCSRAPLMAVGTAMAAGWCGSPVEHDRDCQAQEQAHGGPENGAPHSAAG